MIAIDPQAGFARALLDPQRPCPSGLRCWNGSDVARRFAVHRNNVASAWVAALADTYPVLRQLVGDEFFAATALVYANAQPPAGPVLAHYGAGFAHFLQGFAPARGLPYLADVARLEWLRVRAFHAADASALTRRQFENALRDPQRLAACGVVLHPSVAVLASDCAVVSLWGAHQGAGALHDVQPLEPECALVLRDGEDVLVIGIAAPTCGFICALADGASLADAAPPGLDLADSLALLLRHGAITAWRPPRPA